MTLLQSKRKLVVIEGNDSESENTDFKDEMKLESESSNSDKESENEDNNSGSDNEANDTPSENDNENSDSGDEGGNEDSGDENSGNNAEWTGSAAKILKSVSDSEDTEMKDEIKSESESSNSDKESENEDMSASENDDDSKLENDKNSDSGEEGGNEYSERDENSGNNAGWADSVAKILKTKKPKNKRTLVLSKAKKLTDVVKKEKPAEIGFQIEGEIKDEKPDLGALDEIKTETDEPLKKKRKEMSTVRIKPNILDKDRERTLSKIATRGVVQLFNSVRMQQKHIDYKLQEAGPLERKRETAMKNIDKRAFLDVLMQKKSQSVDGEIKDEVKVESKKKEKQAEPTWNVLRDDFMMGAKLKDWDKETEETSENDVENLSDSD